MSETFETIKKFIDWADSRRIAIAAILFCSLLSPGYLTIYHYKPALFEHLDTLKLLIFSASISVPFILAGALTAFVSFDINLDDEKMIRKVWLYGAAQSGFLLHFCLFASFSEKITTLRSFLLLAVALHAGVFFVFTFCGRVQRWRDLKQKRKHEIGISRQTEA